MKYYTKYKDSETKYILVSLPSVFYFDANDIFLGKDSKRKKEYKNKIMYNKLRGIIINSCKKPKGKDKDNKTNFISHDNLFLEFEKLYNEYLSNKNLVKTASLNNRTNSVIMPIEFGMKMKNDEQLSDDLFSSCK